MTPAESHVYRKDEIEKTCLATFLLFFAKMMTNAQIQITQSKQNIF